MRAAKVARRLSETVARYGKTAPTAVAMRPAGEQVPIESHTRRLAAGAEYLTVMRPVGPLAASLIGEEIYDGLKDALDTTDRVGRVLDSLALSVGPGPRW